MKLFRLPSHRPLRKKASRRLELERLEDRTVMSATLGYSSYLPGPAWAVAVDGGGNVYVTGGYTTGSQGAYAAKVNSTGTALDWVTKLGSSGFGNSIAVDAAGDAYVAGESPDSAFPTTPNALATVKPATNQPGFLTVLNPTGSILYSTWLPGTQFSGFAPGHVNGASLAIDHAGDGLGMLDNVYVTGSALAGFPTTGGAFQSTLAGGTDAFLAKIDPNLSGTASLLYGSYLGGSGSDVGTGVAVGADDNAYIVGRTTSTNLPATAGAFQKNNGGGTDAFVAKFNPSLSGAASLAYSTYLGGSGSDGYWTDFPSVLSVVDPGPGVAVDAAGDAYVAGTTTSANYPTTPGAFQTTYHTATNGPSIGDAFVTKLNATGTGLVYSTYVGGGSEDGASSIALDASGNAYVTGWTRSTDFPTVNPIQATKSQGVDSNNNPNSDVFVTTLNSSGSGLLFSTYFGGAGGSINKNGVFTGSNGDEYGYALALNSAGNVYVTGSTSADRQSSSTSFPTTPGAFQTTPGGGFVFKIGSPTGSHLASPLTASLSSGGPVIPSGVPGGGLNAHGPSAVHAQSTTAAPVTGKRPDAFQTDLSTLLTDGGTFGDWPSDQDAVAAGWSPSDLAFLPTSNALQGRTR
jgi:Beta-propeller repeat